MSPNASIDTAVIFFLLVFIAACNSPDTITDQSLERPNIIFIMTDDHAYQAISAYDSTLISTPNIDRIGAEGAFFEKCFVTNSICAPSRAVILTGKYSHLNGLRDNRDVFNGDQLTFPKLFQHGGQFLLGEPPHPEFLY